MAQNKGASAEPTGLGAPEGAEPHSRLVASPAIPSAVFAVAPESWCAGYLTPGREYRVVREDGGEAFWIVNNNGTQSYCLWSHCGHLRPPSGFPCGSWKRIERPASAIEAPSGVETGNTDSTEGESAVPKGDAQH